MNNSIIILMSTYNGEQYLQEQISSIIHQEDVNPCLIVRDDGSSDKTIELLRQYKERGVLDFYQSENQGPARSFMSLLSDAPESDYYAFSDQDDYWEKDKLSAAISNLKDNKDFPSLYFSCTQLTDAKLNPIPSPKLNPHLTFGESLIYEFIPGCTMVINKPLRDIVITYHPDYIPMHDVWIYSIAQAIGAKIIFDPMPHILYRQHSNNTIGQGYSIWHEWNRRWQRFYNNEESRSRRAKEILKGYYDYIPKENLSLLQSFIKGKNSLSQRICLLSDKRLRCANSTTQYLFWVNLLINKY